MESSSMAMTLLETLELFILGSGAVGVDGTDETGVVELFLLEDWLSSTSEGCEGKETSMGEKGRPKSLDGLAGKMILGLYCCSLSYRACTEYGMNFHHFTFRGCVFMVYRPA